MKITLTDPRWPDLIKNTPYGYNMDRVFDVLALENTTYTQATVTIKDDENNDVLLFSATRESGSKTWKCEFYSDLIDGTD